VAQTDSTGIGLRSYAPHLLHPPMRFRLPPPAGPGMGTVFERPRRISENHVVVNLYMKRARRNPAELEPVICLIFAQLSRNLSEQSGTYLTKIYPHDSLLGSLNSGHQKPAPNLVSRRKARGHPQRSTDCGARSRLRRGNWKSASYVEYLVRPGIKGRYTPARQEVDPPV
jgi:hypothetical protein